MLTQDKLQVLSVTCQDWERKEERLAKATVWDQKQSHTKGSCCSFLSSVNDSRKETSIRVSCWNAQRVLMLQEKLYFRRFQKYCVPPPFPFALPLSVWLYILVIFRHQHCWRGVTTLYTWLYSTAIWFICYVSFVLFKSFELASSVPSTLHLKRLSSHSLSYK